ncbi:hypothetical protein LCGC14_2460080, partial [marine sediment metagenome]
MASARSLLFTLVIAFVGWLVLDWVQSRQSSAATGPNPVVLTVNRQEIRLVGWSQLLQGRLDLARSQADRPPAGLCVACPRFGRARAKTEADSTARPRASWRWPDRSAGRRRWRRGR